MGPALPEPLVRASLVIAHGDAELEPLEVAPALAVPAQQGLGPDHKEVASPVPVEAADDEPEKLVPGAEAGRARATESNLDLLA